MSLTVNATGRSGEAVPLPLADLPATLAYSGSNLTSITVQTGGQLYRQTLTYSGSNVTAISNWVWVAS